jgi:glycerol-3-phosphate dehydrogenase
LIAYLLQSETKSQKSKAIGRGNALDQVYDLAIIGGGINGCGIARDAAGRGLSVFLCEMNDLASGTSSWSTKLIHGGLRYLEYYEFRLVREALIEREVLWRMAPHIIKPLRFVLPHHQKLRPAWLLRLGLFLYDHLGGRKLLPPTRTLDLTTDVAGEPLAKSRFRRGFEYSDCFVDDARLVLLNALDAAARGAVVRTRTRALDLKRVDGVWEVTIEDTTTAQRETIRARRSSTRRAPGSKTFSPAPPTSMCTPRSASSRARTSSCQNSMRTTAPTCSRTRTAASSSSFPTRTISR